MAGWHVCHCHHRCVSETSRTRTYTFRVRAESAAANTLVPSVGPVGLEPTPPRLKVEYAADYATAPFASGGPAFQANHGVSPGSVLSTEYPAGIHLSDTETVLEGEAPAEPSLP